MILGTEERNPASSTLHIVHRVGELSAIYRYEICCPIVVRDVYNFAGYTTGDVDGKCIISLLDEENFWGCGRFILQRGDTLVQDPWRTMGSFCTISIGFSLFCNIRG